MEYRENALCYEDYCRLREIVDWQNFSKEQTQNALHNNLYTVVAVDGSRTVGMGRLIGDGMYFTIVDIVVQPDHQGQGTGGKIMQMILAYIDRLTPAGGRSSVQLIAVKGKEAFYEKMGFKIIPHEFCGSGMRKIIHK